MLPFYVVICMKICPFGQGLLQVRKVSNSHSQAQESKGEGEKKKQKTIQPSSFVARALLAMDPSHCAMATPALTVSCCHGGRDPLCGLVSITSSCSFQRKQDGSPVLNERFSLGFNLT
jgi:hypothetical protein